VKKTLCRGVLSTGLSCDPQVCVARLAGAEEPAALVRATKALWRQYYDEGFSPKASGGAYDDILDELDLR
jgi:hypothetical protein